MERDNHVEEFGIGAGILHNPTVDDPERSLQPDEETPDQNGQRKTDLQAQS